MMVRGNLGSVSGIKHCCFKFSSPRGPSSVRRRCMPIFFSCGNRPSREHSHEYYRSASSGILGQGEHDTAVSCPVPLKDRRGLGSCVTKSMLLSVAIGDGFAAWLAFKESTSLTMLSSIGAI